MVGQEIILCPVAHNSYGCDSWTERKIEFNIFVSASKEGLFGIIKVPCEVCKVKKY